MSVYLYRWGRFAFRHKWIVLPVWLILFVIIGSLGTQLKKPMRRKRINPLHKKSTRTIFRMQTKARHCMLGLFYWAGRRYRRLTLIDTLSIFQKRYLGYCREEEIIAIVKMGFQIPI